MERGLTPNASALDEIQQKYGFGANAIVTMEDVVECLYNKECQGRVLIDDNLKAAIDAYYAEYGVHELSDYCKHGGHVWSKKVYKTMKSVGASNIVLGIFVDRWCDCRRCSY